MGRTTHSLVTACLLAGLISSLFTTFALAHGGGLDAYGCHHNRKLGGYHCHQGPFAGQSFPSKAAMLRRLQDKETLGSGREVQPTPPSPSRPGDRR